MVWVRYSHSGKSSHTGQRDSRHAGNSGQGISLQLAVSDSELSSGNSVLCSGSIPSNDR